MNNPCQSVAEGHQPSAGARNLGAQRPKFLVINMSPLYIFKILHICTFCFTFPWFIFLQQCFMVLSTYYYPLFTCLCICILVWPLQYFAFMFSKQYSDHISIGIEVKTNLPILSIVLAIPAILTVLTILDILDRPYQNINLPIFA